MKASKTNTVFNSGFKVGSDLFLKQKIQRSRQNTTRVAGGWLIKNYEDSKRKLRMREVS